MKRRALPGLLMSSVRWRTAFDPGSHRFASSSGTFAEDR